MIIHNASSPDKSLYVIGGHIIEALSLKKNYPPLDLYNIVKENHDYISLQYFYFSLDWLFIANIVDLTETGDIKLCN